MAELAITALYLLIFLRVSLSWLRHRDPLLLSVMPVFASMAMWFVLMVISLVHGTPPPMAASILVLLFLAQPFLMLLLVSKLRAVPMWALATALLILAASGVPVMIFPQPLVPPVSLFVAGGFVAMEIAAAVLLATEARRRGGAARLRLWSASIGTALMGVVLLVVAAGANGPTWSRGMALGSAVMYMLAFTPPRWVRRVWSWGAAYDLIRRLVAAPADEPAERTWQRYCESARLILGVDSVAVMLAGQTIAEPPLSEVLPDYPADEIQRLLAADGTVDALAGYTHPSRIAADLARITDTRYVNAAPLAVPAGALVLLRRRRTLFADDDVHLFAELAAQAAAVAERADILAEQRRLAAQAERDAAERRTHHSRRLESLGQLAGGVAHDFNNILAVVGSYTELLSETVEDPGAQEDLAQIRRAVDRATGLTKQLLAFGRREITRAQVLSLNHVIGDVEQTVRRSLGEHIHLVLHLDRELWPVSVDPGQLEQILLNLAVNARDAMPGGGTLSIDTANVHLDEEDLSDAAALSPGRYARMRISDTGTGMPPEVVERAFEPFFTTKPRGAGTGLGLATVYGIAAAAGGHVRLHSEPGIGTTVILVLPATEIPAAERPAVVAATPPPARDRPQETVLLVEDEDALRGATARILGRAGYHVLVADGGDTALRLAREHEEPIHLLLTDVIMPGMLGNQVAARVHELRPGIPVLYMSGYAQPVLTENGTLPAGVSIIEKPFTSTNLLDRVHARLHAGTPAQG